MSDWHILQELLTELSQGEYDALTCVKMALKWGDQEYRSMSGTMSSAYDTAMSSLTCDWDKLRNPQTTAGKKLMYLYDGWQSKRRIMQGVDQWIENATPEKIEILLQLLEDDA